MSHKLALKSFTITECIHSKVPNYLSAADVALALVKIGESKKHLSPIKVGEYWSCGLPVLIPKGIGDETQIIDTEGGGATFKNYTKQAIFEALNAIVIEPKKNRALAKKYRSFEIVRKTYNKWYS